MQQILYADNFINSSQDIGQQERINTILNETFQLTVRQKIYENDDEESDGENVARLNIEQQESGGPFRTSSLKIKVDEPNSQTESSVDLKENEELDNNIYSRFSNVALDGTVRKLDIVDDFIV